jgi:hypothetical protein
MKESNSPDNVMVVTGCRAGVASHPQHGSAMVLAIYGQDNMATAPMILTEQCANDLLDAIQTAFPLAFPKGGKQ